MGYFYHYELILAGVILLSAMMFGGIRLWLNRRKESQEQLENTDKVNLASDESNINKID